MTFQLIVEIVAILGFSLSLLVLYVIGVCNKEELQKTSLLWSEFAPYFTASSSIFLVFSLVEAIELITSFYIVAIREAIFYLYLTASFGIMVLLLLLLKSILKTGCIEISLGESVFYGKFGLTLVYITVFLLGVDRIKDIPGIYHLLKLVSESLFVAFIPVFLYITLRSIKYSALVKKGVILAPPHTLNVFLGVATSFAIFFMAMLFNSIGDDKLYNMLEIGSFFVFALVGIAYGETMEQLLRINERKYK